MSYARVIHVPGVAPALFSVYVSALPLGMLNLALLLFARERTGSIEVGAVVIAGFGLGNAVGLIAQGKFLDRGAARLTIGLTGLLCTCTLVASTLCPPPSVPTPFYIALVVIAGASVPAVTTFVRSSLPVLVTDGVSAPAPMPCSPSFSRPLSPQGRSSLPAPCLLRVRGQRSLARLGPCSQRPPPVYCPPIGFGRLLAGLLREGKAAHDHQLVCARLCPSERGSAPRLDSPAWLCRQRQSRTDNRLSLVSPLAHWRSVICAAGC